MDKIKNFICNSLWLLLSFNKYLKFRIASKSVKETQEKILMRLIKKNQLSEFGQKNKFSSIKSIADFQKRLPLTDYDYYSESVSKIEKGGENILACEKVLILEPTSGSAGMRKLIPYNKTLREQFRNGISPWIFSILSSNWRILFGSAYWSITPLAQELEYSSGGTPIGFKDDSEYFGSLERKLIERIMAVPKEICLERDIDNYRYVTLYFLLKDRNLSFISVWNPTFLTILLEHLEGWAEKLVGDIKNGSLSVPKKEFFVSGQALSKRLKPDPKRAERLQKALSLYKGDKVKMYKAIWPNLSLISCWADGNSLSYSKALEKLFPLSKIQPKGLILTEGFVSLPHRRALGTVLSLESHFFEFINDAGKILLAFELIKGMRYSVVLTTGSGFYRYQTGDIIEVVGYFNQAPCLRFVGRENNVSDLFGEKLNERNVAKILEDVFRSFQVELRFFMLAPETLPGRQPAYVLFVEKDRPSQKDWTEITEAIEEGLRQNFHYDYCRRLGQLGKLQLKEIKEGGAKTYIDSCCLFGQRLGDIKPQALHRMTGWSERFGLFD